MRCLEQVKDFMRLANQDVPSRITVPDVVTVALRIGLISEEVDELLDALMRPRPQLKHHLTELAKEIADLLYVVIGAAVDFGLPLKEVFDRVHESNMLKVGAPKNSLGKLLKPAGWKAPKLDEIIERAK